MSVELRGMNLEPVQQSKVSHKEKISYFNAYIQNLENGTDEPICRTGIDTDIENRIVDTVEEEVDGTERELKHVYYHM